jgi:hypothetical protein
MAHDTPARSRRVVRFALRQAPFNEPNPLHLAMTASKRIEHLRNRLHALKEAQDEAAHDCANFAGACCTWGPKESPHHMERTYGEARDLYAHRWGRLQDLIADVKAMISQIEHAGEIRYPQMISKAGHDPNADLIFERAEQTEVPARPV